MKLQEIIEYFLIRKSELFNSAYYLSQYPDVRRADIDPLMHYIQFGWKEGRNPSAGFNTLNYLSLYPDVKSAKINPLFHYIKYGKMKGESSKRYYT